LRAYRKHQPANDLLADPGEQDLTAHVNFSAVQQAGETAGLITEAFTTQEQLLASIASRIWNKMKPLNAWTASQKRQFQTLTHPDHLGRSFRVLIQSKPR
jgi:SAM-dependent MidA family methyltransferase